MTDFRIDDLIHDGDWYDRINTFDHDLPFYRRLAQEADGPVLELCAGSGRLTLPLAEAGVAVTGLDVSPLMLAAARRKAAARGVEAEFVEGDMRYFDLGRRFALIFVPFNSLQVLYTDEDVSCALERIRAHLLPDSRFVFDVFNPDPRVLVERSEGWTETFRFMLDDGRECVVSERCDYDDAAQVNRVTWRYEAGDEERRAQLDIRCFYPREMDLVLARHGFEVEDKFGDFEGTPFRKGAGKMVYVCRAAV